MKLRRAAAVGLLASSLSAGLAACGPTETSGPNARPTIELGHFKDRTLPDAVKKAAGSAVRIAFADGDFASGAYIGQGEVLGTGHLIQDENNKPIHDCRKGTVMTIAGHTAVLRVAGANQPGNDQGLYTVDKKDPAVSDLKAVNTAFKADHPDQATRVFFANLAHDGRAIYDGFVAGPVTKGEQKGMVAVVTGPGVSKSYGDVREDAVGAGDSGEPVFDKYGGEWGEVSSAAVDSVEPIDVTNAFGTALHNYTGKVQITYVQPIGATGNNGINAMRRKLQDC